MNNRLIENSSKLLQSLRGNEEGRIGYFILWLGGAPIGLIIFLWVIFGNNLLTPG